ncbi:MAG TPA: LysM peptidoglycan-binding domain-containing protein [Thermomicrobiaceae bacterium]|nr:LysM peptidoglycan-binding domain-containing protein [Thermomicrobiaceae bacterium]
MQAKRAERMSRSQRWRRALVALAACLAVWLLSSASGAAASYEVQSGDTLSGIADAYGVPLSVLAERNHIGDVNLVYAGQQLVVPGQAPPAGPPPATDVYHAQAGDSLWSIAALRQTTLAQLIAANPEIVDPNHIVVDQAISVPSAAAPAQATNVPALLEHYAGVYGLDPALVKAVAWQESGWRQNVVSPDGALGVMQLLPSTGDWLAQDVVGQPLDVAGSADDNVHGGVAFLRFLIDRTGSVQLAVAAYYQGPGSLQRDGMLAETQHYVDNVMAIRSYLMLYGVPPGA